MCVCVFVCSFICETRHLIDIGKKSIPHKLQIVSFGAAIVVDGGGYIVSSPLPLRSQRKSVRDAQ